MWAKVIGGAVTLGLVVLLIWLFGNSRFNAGELAERVKWQSEMRKAEQEVTRLNMMLAERPVKAMTVYTDRLTQLQPIIQRQKEVVKEYAQTADGARHCLSYQWVLDIEKGRGAIFPDYSPPTSQGAGALPTPDAPTEGLERR